VSTIVFAEKFGRVLYTPVPNQRAEGQKLIPIPMKEDFIAQIDSAYARMGYSNRSEFIRSAILEKLERGGFRLPAGIALAPDRLGKGGAPKVTRYPAPNPSAFGVNDQPASTEKVAADLADVARAKVAHTPHKSPPKPAADRATSKKERRVHGAPKR
jgi:Arc/MetJ-type ribon-helix-helix transcriptional regulator